MFKIKNTGNSTYTFTFYMTKNQKLVKSIAYTSYQDIQGSIKELQQMPVNSLIERKTKPNGKFYFVLKNEQGKIVAESWEYSSESGMDKEILLLKSSFADAEIG